MEIMKYKCSYEDNLENIADPIVHKMLERQVEQGNPRDVSVFEGNRNVSKASGGFNWHNTPEGQDFWRDVLTSLNFGRFFEKYPELAEATQDAQVLVAVQDDELMNALNRIESKLDQLLATPAPTELPCKDIVEFRVGDKVRVKSWKEIKSMTTKDEDGDREFDDGGYFTKHDKEFCGIDGVVISTGILYVTTRIDGQEVRLHYKALEKLNH